jgi:molybdenum cofactor cytidylyltransferase
MFIRGIILAAGTSSRMGSNKLMLKIDNSTILEKVIENSKISKLNEIMLITGKYDIDTEITKVHNEEYEKGMSTSIKKGIESFKGEAVMILLGDMPFVSSQIINKLYDSFRQCNKNIVVPVFEGRRGNPVIIGEKYFKDLLNNIGDKGAREIIRNNIQDVEWVEIQDKGIFLDIDDEVSFKQFTIKEE